MRTKDAFLYRAIGSRPAFLAVMILIAAFLAGPSTTIDAAAQAPEGFDMGEILGGGGGSFEVLEAANQEFITDKETGDLVTYKANGRFRYKSKDMELECEHLVYTAAKNLLVATGSPCKIRRDTNYAECRQLEYATKDNKMVLTGNPFVRSLRNGQNMNTWGTKITFVQTPDGYMKTLVEGGKTRPSDDSTSSKSKTGKSGENNEKETGGVITVNPAPKETPATKKTTKSSAPVRIDSDSKLDKIPAIGVEE